MDFLEVPVSNIAGMIFTLVVAIGTPIFLLLYLYRKKKARIYSFLIGCAAFFISAMVLEQLMHALVLNGLGDVSTTIKNNVFLYALYGGLAAGIFEETGRFVAMKFVMKQTLTRENVLMYGAGHGGMEAFLLIGGTYANNIIISFMINSGNLAANLADSPDKEQIINGLKPLAQMHAGQFYLAGIERLFAIALQISLSVLVYMTVKNHREWKYFILAVAAHAGINFIAVVVSDRFNLYFAEAVIFLGTLLTAFLAYKAYLRSRQEATE